VQPDSRFESTRFAQKIGPFESTATWKLIGTQSVDGGENTFNHHHHHHHLIFKAHETSKSVQIKAGTTREETALTVALKIHINVCLCLNSTL